MTILAAPVFGLVIWLLLRDSPVERRDWLGWDREHLITSSLWTALFAVFAVITLLTLREDVKIRLPLNALADVGWLYVWFAMRAVVISRVGKDPEANHPVQAAIVLPRS